MQGSPEASHCRILVVEDEPMVLELIVTRLKLARYLTFHGRNGYEGLERLNEVRPHGMILDINMPQLDGFGVLRRMKQSGQLERTPVMVLTARNQTDDVQTAIKLGARDFLAKPFKDAQLLTRVARLVRRQPILRPDADPDPSAILL